MAREPMVTRTIKGTNVKALCVSISAQNTVIKDFTLSGTYSDEKSLLKALTKTVQDNDIKVVSIISASQFETLYGMSENDFIKSAKVLPPRKVQD